jgi:hypothetical protein
MPDAVICRSAVAEPAESMQGSAPLPKRLAAAAALLQRRGALPAVVPKRPAAEAVNGT